MVLAALVLKHGLLRVRFDKGSLRLQSTRYAAARGLYVVLEVLGYDNRYSARVLAAGA